MTETQSEVSVEDEPRAPNNVEVRVAANLEQLSVLRAVAAHIAMREDFDLDAIADLKMAVDEVCSTLIMRASPGSTLTCRFQTHGDDITVRSTVLSDTDSTPSRESFGWRVLTTLTDTVNTWIAPASADPGGYLTHIELVKRRGSASG